MSESVAKPGPLLRAIYLLFCLICLVATGCGSGIDRTLEQTEEHTFKVEPGASVSVKNTDGSIRIYGSPTNEIKIEAIKKAYSQERLNQIAINISAQPNTVSINTVYPPKKKWGLFDRSGTVDYILTVPYSCTVETAELVNGELLVEGMRGKSVHASLVNGRLLNHNCFGKIECSVVSGGLDVAYDWWENRKFSVGAKITDGNLRASIPGDAAFHLIASTLTGQIRNEFADMEDRQGALVQKIDSIINSNSEAEVKLQAVDGNIKVMEANP